MNKIKEIATKFAQWMSNYSVRTIKKDGWLWSKDDEPQYTIDELYDKFIDEEKEKKD